MVQLELYRVFLAVAKNRSFSKAAEELHISQPAISQSISSLEKELETQLFIRTSRGIRLTGAGETLYSYVEQALSIIKGGETQIYELKALKHGTLNIGASDTLCRHYLLPHLQHFHNKYPGVKLRVTNRTSKETVDLLKHGKVDIGFINMPTELDDNISVQELEQIQDCFVYSEKHFPDLRGQTDLQTLQTYPILMLEKESSSRRYVDSFLKTHNVVPFPQIELGSHDLLLSFAEIGLGVAAVVKEYSKSYISSGKLTEVNLIPEIPKRSIAFISLTRIPLTFSAKEFIKLLSSYRPVIT